MVGKLKDPYVYSSQATALAETEDMEHSPHTPPRPLTDSEEEDTQESPDIFKAGFPVPEPLNVDTLTLDSRIYLGTGMKLAIVKDNFYVEYESLSFGHVKYWDARSFSLESLKVLQLKDWRDMLTHCTFQPFTPHKPKPNLRQQLFALQHNVGVGTFLAAGLHIAYDDDHFVKMTSQRPFRSEKIVKEVEERFRKSWKKPREDSFKESKEKKKETRKKLELICKDNTFSEMLQEPAFSLSNSNTKRYMDMGDIPYLLTDPAVPGKGKQASSTSSGSKGSEKLRPKVKAEQKAKELMKDYVEVIEFMDMSKPMVRHDQNNTNLDPWFELLITLFTQKLQKAAEEFFKHRIVLRQECTQQIIDEQCRDQAIQASLVSRFLMAPEEARQVGVTLKNRMASLTTTAMVHSPGSLLNFQSPSVRERSGAGPSRPVRRTNSFRGQWGRRSFSNPPPYSSPRQYNPSTSRGLTTPFRAQGGGRGRGTRFLQRGRKNQERNASA